MRRHGWGIAMQTIWKKILPVTATQVIEVPGDAEILSVNRQHEQLVIWYTCDPTLITNKNITILMCGTGHIAPEFSKYIGTVLLNDDSLVIHVFEQMQMQIPVHPISTSQR
jgi:hypothetical protein